MPVSSSDLIAYASLNMPVIDTGTSGGAIDPDMRVVFSQLAANDTITAVSTSSGDTTQSMTVSGRTAAGIVSSEVKTLTGLTPITFSTLGTVARVLKVSMNADAAGIVTIATTGAFTVATIPIGERGFIAFHQQGQASAGVGQDFYYKIFLKNTNGSLTFTSPTVSLSSDPSGRMTFALATSINDSGSVANRKTTPGLTFNTNAKASPSNLAAGDAIGVWIYAAHPAAESDQNTVLTLAISGT